PAGASEIYCHPAPGQLPAMADMQEGYDHAGELAALVSPRVRACVAGSRVRLVSYATLADERREAGGRGSLRITERLEAPPGRTLPARGPPLRPPRRRGGPAARARG